MKRVDHEILFSNANRLTRIDVPGLPPGAFTYRGRESYWELGERWHNPTMDAITEFRTLIAVVAATERRP